MGVSRHQRPSGAASAAALLLVQLALGYEWLVSGLTKLAHGDFPGGLASVLADETGEAPGWYGAFLDRIVAPHAAVFGYAIEVGEVLVGSVLLGGAVLFLSGRSLSSRPRRALQFAVLGASVAALLMLVNFELASGASFGLHLGAESFDEGVDLDTLMIGLQLALLVPVIRDLRAGKLESRAESHSVWLWSAR